jgi:hypothetical protein
LIAAFNIQPSPHAKEKGEAAEAVRQCNGHMVLAFGGVISSGCRFILLSSADL